MVPILLIISVALAYFYPVLNCKNILIERDLSAYFIPPRFIWVQTLAFFKQFPFWNPYNFCGAPLFATSQHGVLYPPNLLHLFAPFNVAWNWIIILHFAFAGISSYLLFRYIRISKMSSLLGALIFMLSGYLISIHSLLTHLLAIPWIPLVILMFLRYLAGKRMRDLCLASLFLSMVVFAGAMELVILVIPVLMLMLVWRGKGRKTDGPPMIREDLEKGDVRRSEEMVGSTCHRAESIGRWRNGWFVRFLSISKVAGLLIVLFLLFSSVQLLPFLELKNLSIRASGLSYQEATIWSFGWKDFLLFFLPDAYGYYQNESRYWANQAWLKTVYLGIAPFVLSIYYFMSRDKRRLFFAILILFSFALALGGNTPLYRLLYHLPPFSSIRYPVKFLFLFFLVISATSALGLDLLKRDVVERSVGARRYAKIIFYIGFVFAGAWGFCYFADLSLQGFLDRMGIKPGAFNEISFNLHNLKRFLLFSFVFCVMILVLFRSKRKGLASAVIVGVIGLDLFLANFGFFLAVPHEYFFSTNPVIERLKEGQTSGERYFVTEKTQKAFKHFPYDKYISAPYYAGFYGMYSVGGTEVMRVARNDTILAILNNTGSPQNGQKIFDILGTRYLVSSYRLSEVPMYNEEARFTLGEKEAYVYEYTGMPGKFLLYGAVRFVTSDDDVVKLLNDKTFNVQRELILSGGSEKHLDRGRVEGSVRVVSYTPNEIRLETVTDRDAFLYVSDTYYPGWKAFIDGKKGTIYRANLAYRAVEVPAGRHSVVFTYVPGLFYIGGLLTILGIAMSLVCVVLQNRKTKAP